MKFNTRLTLLFLLIAFIPIIIIYTLSFYITKKALTMQVLNQLGYIASIDEHRIKTTNTQNIEKTALILNRTQLRLILESYLRDKKREDQEKMNRFLRDSCSSIESFMEIHILAPDGYVVASTDQTEIGAGYMDEKSYIMGRKRIFIDDFFLDENQNLRQKLSGPFILDNKILGVLVIESNPDDLMSLVKDYSGLGKTGETLLAKKDENGDALLITPLRFDPDASLRRIIPINNAHDPMVQALLKKEEPFVHVDVTAVKIFLLLRDTLSKQAGGLSLRWTGMKYIYQ